MDLQELKRWIGQRRLVVAAASRAAPLDAAVLRRTKGRVGLLALIRLPQCLLTTTGRRSGQPRTVTLLFGRRGGEVLLAGSNFGHPNHPAWALNLAANPHAEVEIGGMKRPMTARLVTDPREREEVWAIMYDLWPAYNSYRGRAGRQIKLFSLTPTPTLSGN